MRAISAMRAAIAIAAPVIASCLAVLDCNALSGADALSVDDDAKPSQPDGGAPDSGATPITPPKADSGAREAGVDASADAGPVLHVFVTSTAVAPTFTGVAGGDAICNQRAAEAGRSGRWVAWLSGAGTVASSRIEADGPWLLFDGRTAVASRAELTSGSIAAPIDVDEKGATGIADAVWTGTYGNGTAGADCSNWYANTCIGSCPEGLSGRTDLRTSAWTNNASPACLGAPQRLYCFEQ